MYCCRCWCLWWCLHTSLMKRNCTCVGRGILGVGAGQSGLVVVFGEQILTDLVVDLWGVDCVESVLIEQLVQDIHILIWVSIGSKRSGAGYTSCRGSSLLCCWVWTCLCRIRWNGIILLKFRNSTLDAPDWTAGCVFCHEGRNREDCRPWRNEKEKMKIRCNRKIVDRGFGGSLGRIGGCWLRIGHSSTCGWECRNGTNANDEPFRWWASSSLRIEPILLIFGNERLRTFLLLYQVEGDIIGQSKENGDDTSSTTYGEWWEIELHGEYRDQESSEAWIQRVGRNRIGERCLYWFCILDDSKGSEFVRLRNVLGLIWFCASEWGPAFLLRLGWWMCCFLRHHTD